MRFSGDKYEVKWENTIYEIANLVIDDLYNDSFLIIQAPLKKNTDNLTLLKNTLSHLNKNAWTKDSF